MNITPETWKPAVGFDGRYEISDLGRIRNAKGRVLKPFTRKTGHQAIYLRGTDRHVCPLIHVLVLEAFSGARPKDSVGRHLNGNGSDNRLGNLSWGTHTENAADREIHGTSNSGARNGRAKLSDADVAEIRQSNEMGSRLAERFGVTPTQISAIRKGRSWQK